MNSKYENLKTIMDSGMVLIIRTDSEDEAKNIAVAAVEGGIKALEITMAVPNAVNVIAFLANKYKNENFAVARMYCSFAWYGMWKAESS